MKQLSLDSCRAQDRAEDNKMASGRASCYPALDIESKRHGFHAIHRLRETIGGRAKIEAICGRSPLAAKQGNAWA